MERGKLNFWSRLVSPLVPYADPGRQLDARVVGAISSTLFFVFGLAQLLMEIFLADFHTSAGHVVGYSMMMASFVLNRVGRYQPAALILVVMFGLVPLLRVFSGASNTPVSTLAFITLSLLLGGVLLSGRALLVVAAMEFLAVLALSFAMPEVIQDRNGLVDIVLILIVGTVISVFGIRHRIRVENRRRADLEASEKRYRELSEQLEQRVKERTAELESTNQELESFSSSVSHDLRSPLMGVDGYAAIISQDYANVLDADAQDLLSNIRSAAKRMSRLIDDLLKLARMTRSTLTRTRCDVSARCAAIIKELRVGEPGRSVVLDVDPNLIAQADETLLGVVLENLLGNAWKFTRGKTDARITVGKTKHEGALAYFVRDNGAGFDMAYSDKLFAPFQRLHSAKDFEGNGVGLASVERVVKRHGGWIRAEGKPNEGATFFFTLGEAP
jgi:signal transduction histidine kinase